MKITNKKLQELLKQFPDDMDVLINKNGAIYTPITKPIVKFMGTSQKDCIVIQSEI